VEQFTPSALAYAQTHGLHALVVERDGHIIAEAYSDGYELTTPHPLYSGAKSFWGVVAVVAEQDGVLALDERVADTFPAWEHDDWKRQVTVRQLLSLTGGIGFGGLGSSVPTQASALSVELRNEPGTTFTYGGIPLQIFGAVLAHKLHALGQTPHDYLQRRILDPIGMRIERWRTLADGSHPLPTGAFVSACEWLKYGRFVNQHHQEFAECFVGSASNPRYGLGFWLGVRGAPPDLVYASGAGGQALYMLPSSQLVIVHFGKARTFKHQAFLSRVFSQHSSIRIKR
jgi:CubicO group peptidase (beta-lactamase class C family)